MFSFASENYFILELPEQSCHQWLTWVNDELQYNREQRLQTGACRLRQQVTFIDPGSLLMSFY